jgi:hypothetical protein
MKIFVFFIAFLCSCDNNIKTQLKDREVKEINFKNSSLKQAFQASISKIKIPDSQLGNNILLEFYLDSSENFDTIISIKHCPPTNVKNLILEKKYNNKRVYIYCSEELFGRLDDFIEIGEAKIDSVYLAPVGNEYECIFEDSYKLTSNKFILREYPIKIINE